MPVVTASYVEELRRFIESRDFSGYDPYDALNSALVRVFSLGLPAGRMAWTQLFRRSPVNLRPLFGVPRRLNAKGLGLFLEAYSKLHGMEVEGAGPRKEISSIIEKLIGQLDSLRSRNCSGAAWGYPFDWQSRAAFVPAGTPTIVNTSFIGHALLDCHERTGNARALALAQAIPPFLLGDLNRDRGATDFCFSYTPLDRNFVHNANMLGASLLLRLGVREGNAEWQEAAHRSMTYSVARQRPDGSWPYAETSFQGWIDSFHTGFNLEALRWFIRLGQAPPAWQAAYHRGVSFYADRFFLEDGTPKYYHDRVYPIDIHAPAEAVFFFSGEGKVHAELTDRVLRWMLGNLRDERQGFFYFRKSRHLTNRIPYMRWSQAWAMRALVEYQLHRGE